MMRSPLYCLILVSLSLLSVGPGCQRKSNSKSEVENGAKKQARNQTESKPVFAFVDRTQDSGIEGMYRNGTETQMRTMLETLGGGVGVVDFDLDGQMDCFFNGGGIIGKDKSIAGVNSFLFRNLNNWKFENCSHESCVDTSNLYDHGCQFGDFDNDGFRDLVVTGYQGILVFRNLGDGSFETIQCGIESNLWATSAAVGDFNNDGNLDLFICNYLDWSFKNHKMCAGPNGQTDVCSPNLFKGVVDDLFTSQGDWTFVKDGKRKGITANGKGLGVVVGDIDLDGDVDIYVANDVTNNLLYINAGNGSFEEKGATIGVDTGDRSIANGSMGTSLVDFNLDGLPDIGVTNFEHEDFALYRQVRLGESNSNAFIFNLASKKSKLSAIDQMYVSWGTVFEDLDADGDDDLIINNGHIEYFPDSGTVMQQPQILANEDGVFRYKNVVESDYFEKLHHGRGLVTADLDNDGDLDLLFANCNESFAVLENTSPQKQPLSRISLIGTDSNRDGIGLSVPYSSGDGVKVRSGGGSYLSSLDPAIWLHLDANFMPAVSGFKEIVFVREKHEIIGVEVKNIDK